jgi:prepilin-type N-terminal cleavage/methylation domain-containing protein
MLTYFTSRHSLNKGFTLTELVVSIGIMLIIMGIVLTNQSSYSQSMLLSNETSSIALALRQAQVYGISVKEVAPGSDEFTAGYGLAFDTTSNGSNTIYIAFADRTNGANKYLYDYGGDWSTCEVGETSECLTKTVLQGGNVISSLCEISLSDNEDCSIGRVDVTFTRPETDAHFTFFDTTGQQITPSDVKAAKISLTSPANVTKSVTVYTTGQISEQ